MLTSIRWYYLDLSLPRSDASAFQEFIALPDFDDRRDFGEEPCIESKYEYNFLSMISLRRLIHRSFEELYERKLPQMPLPHGHPNQLTKSNTSQQPAATTMATKQTGPSSSPSSHGSWTSGARSSRLSCAETTPRARRTTTGTSGRPPAASRPWARRCTSTSCWPNCAAATTTPAS